MTPRDEAATRMASLSDFHGLMTGENQVRTRSEPGPKQVRSRSEAGPNRSMDLPMGGRSSVDGGQASRHPDSSVRENLTGLFVRYFTKMRQTYLAGFSAMVC
jgi:hypothetical protein